MSHSTFTWAINQEQKDEWKQLFQKNDSNKTGFVPAESIRDLLTASQLPTDALAQIWDQADRFNRGASNFNQNAFFVAKFLIYAVQANQPIPKAFPPSLFQSLGVPLEKLLVSFEQYLKYKSSFKSVQSDGFVSATTALQLFQTSGLDHSILSAIWNLSDMDTDQKLNETEFVIATHLINTFISEGGLPQTIPREMKSSIDEQRGLCLDDLELSPEVMIPGIVETNTEKEKVPEQPTIDASQWERIPNILVFSSDENPYEIPTNIEKPDMDRYLNSKAPICSNFLLSSLYGVSETPLEEYDAAAEIVKVNYIPMDKMHQAYVAADSMVRANYSQLEQEAKLYQSIVEKGTFANAELQQLEKILDKLCASVRKQWDDCYAKEIKLKALAQEIKSLEQAAEEPKNIEHDLSEITRKTHSETEETIIIREDADLYQDEINSLQKKIKALKNEIDPNFENVVSVKPSFVADFPSGTNTPPVATISGGQPTIKPPQQSESVGVVSSRSVRRVPAHSTRPGPISR